VKKEADSPVSTMLALSMVLLLLYFIFAWQWATVVSFVLGCTGIFSQYLSKIIAKFWLKSSQIMGRIISSLLLSIIFYFFLWPLAALSKLFVKDPLMLSGKYNSYFIDMRKDYKKKDFEKPW